jgi:hypothetical protein
VYFWNSLTFFRHVQLVDHFIGGGFDLWNHARAAAAFIGMPRDNGANIAARTHPFAVVPGERAPSRWLRIVDSFRDRLYERPHALRGDGNGLTAVDLLQVLHAVLRDHELFGRMGR